MSTVGAGNNGCSTTRRSECYLLPRNAAAALQRKMCAVSDGDVGSDGVTTDDAG